MHYKRWIGRAGAATALGVVLVGVAGAPAQAQSSGCAQADGSLGAKNCIDVEGFATRVDRVVSSYGVGVGQWPPLANEICQRKHQVMFTRAGSSVAEVQEGTALGCVWPIPMIDNDWYVWENLGEMVNGSQLCTRSNNSATNTNSNNYNTPGGGWTPWACVMVKNRHWWTVS